MHLIKYLTHDWGDKEVYTFHKGFSLKVSGIARQELKIQLLRCQVC